MATQNPYSYMQIDEEEENPWSTWEPWEIGSPSIPDFPSAAELGDPGSWRIGDDYQIPGNVDAEGNPVNYPGGWGPSPIPGTAGSSPLFSLNMPTRRTGTVTNPASAMRRVVPGLSPTTTTEANATAGQTTLTPQEWNYWAMDDQGLKALQTWAQTMIPLAQAQQNAWQWGSEFSEANRRWDLETPWRMGLEQYNADLATRQQQMAEMQARDASRQWAREFNRQAANDQFAQDLANRELALAEERMGRELTLAERQQVWQETYQQATLDIRREEIEAQLMAARYGAFGRGQAPARWVSNWG